ncbi:MAG: helix-turn-helix domain-containing protein [Planctomycetota bacterium]
MHNFASISTGRSQIQTLELFRLWDVDEDDAYQIKRIWDGWEGPNSTMPTKGRDGLCAVRTVRGEGWLETNDKTRRMLGPDSLAIFPWSDLAGWGTSGSSWRFYWFEFYTDKVDALILSEPVAIPVTVREREEISSIQTTIRSPLEPSRRGASARFASQLYQWLDQAETDGATHRRHAGIEQAIDLMHSSVDCQLSVAEMARQAGLGQRAFTNIFEQVTGQTPKRYHLNLRLEAARAMLLSGRMNVKQAAEQLGFSSPFYLSKLYNKRYGHPPSKAH